MVSKVSGLPKPDRADNPKFFYGKGAQPPARISRGSRTITSGEAADPIMLDPLFGFHFMQTSTRFPEQMPVDRDEEGRAAIRRSGCNRSPCCSSSRKVGSQNWSCQGSAKCQGLHPGSPHSNPWRCGSPPAEGNAGKNRLGRSGVFHGTEAPPTSAWEHTQHRTLRALNAAAPPRLLLLEYLPSLRFYRAKNVPAAFHVWHPALYQWDKRNPDCCGVPEHCHEAREIRMLRISQELRMIHQYPADVDRRTLKLC